MKTLILSLGAGMALFSAPIVSSAITTKELNINCRGTYQVLTSSPFARHNAPRLGGITYGLKESVQVLSIQGADCAKLKPYYNIDLKVGQVLPLSHVYGDRFYEVTSLKEGLLQQNDSDLQGVIQKMAAVAKTRIGNKYGYAATQGFSLTQQTKAGQELPLFPLIHQEYVYVLSLSGQVNAQKAYGTPSTLNDKQIITLMQKLMEILREGGSTSSLDSEFLSVLLSLSPQSKELQLEMVNNLVNLFELKTKQVSTFYTGGAIQQLGQHLNTLLNVLGGTKFQTQLQVLQTQPLLLATDTIAEILGQPTYAPSLTAAQVEAFLVFAYEKSLALKAIQMQVTEAAYLLSQYKMAAVSIQKYSKPFMNGPFKIPLVFSLTPRSAQLVKQIITL